MNAEAITRYLGEAAGSNAVEAAAAAAAASAIADSITNLLDAARPS